MPALQPILYRQATASDALCIAALGVQVFLDTYATQGIRPALAQEAFDAFSPDELLNILAKPDVFITVAEADGHLVGFAQVAMNTGHDLIAHPRACELQRLYVQERFTGKGVGRGLLDATETSAQLCGAALLWATVWVGNRRALSFYPRQGYALMGSPSYTFQNETHENQLFGKVLSQ